MSHTTQLQVSLLAKLGRLGLATARALLSHRKSNSKIQLAEQLQCPACRSRALKFDSYHVAFTGCGKQCEVVVGVPRMSVGHHREVDSP